MSLIKQLWIAIAVVMSISFGGSFAVSTLSARHYLEQQLSIKNHDNANSLALSLSQMDKDPVTIELQIASQFDAGHYRLIRLVDPQGSVIVEQEYNQPASGAPDWFTRMIPIKSSQGVAQVSDGWKQFGTLTVESHSRYAYQALWNGTQQLLLWFLLGGAVTGIIGTLIIKLITRPLGRMVGQAEAIGSRRFVTTPEPSTVEFRSVVRAMNALSERVRAMLAEESRRLEQLRRQYQHDELTGLIDRNQFLNQLTSTLTRDDASAEGALIVARLDDLGEINRLLGRESTDTLIKKIAQQMVSFAEAHNDWEVGRLNASDFAILAPGTKDTDIANQALELAQSLHQTLDASSDLAALQLSVGSTSYSAGEQRSTLLARVDGALAAAELSGDREVKYAGQRDIPLAHTDLHDWRNTLTSALENPEGIGLGHYPVLTKDGELLHYEAPARLYLDGAWKTAGYFMPWASRLGMMAKIDAAVVRAALSKTAGEGVTLDINLSSASICDVSFCGELFTLLNAAQKQGIHLSVEVAEYDVLRHFAEFRALCSTLNPLGCKLGIKHAGPRFSRIENLHELGLDYLKIDAAIITGIDHNPGNQTFLRGLCLIAHSIGLTIIAEGVTTAAEIEILPNLGIDYMTGPAINLPN